MKRTLAFILVLIVVTVSLYAQDNTGKKKGKDTSSVVDSVRVDSLSIDSTKPEKVRIDTVVNLDTIVMSDTLMKTLKGYVSSSSIEGSPVIFMNDTLFYVYAQIGPYTPQERANSIMERLLRISKDPTVKLDSIRIINEESFSNIIVGDLVLMSVTDVDAKIVGLSHQDLALANSVIIKSTLYKYFEDTSFEAIVIGSVFALIATIVLILFTEGYESVFSTAICLDYNFKRYKN